MRISTAHAITGASVILGVSLIFSALIEQGIVLQPDGSRQKGRVITTPSGHVNLGVVYSESKMVDITVNVKNKFGENEEILSLKGISPHNYVTTIDQALKETLINHASKTVYRNWNSLQKTVDINHVALRNEGVLHVTTRIHYKTEYQPDYTLLLASHDYAIPTDRALKSFILQKTGNMIDSSHKAFRENMFLQGDN